MRIMKNQFWLVAMVILAFTGCVQVPKTIITGEVAANGAHRWKISAPKDAAFDGLDVSRDSEGVLHVALKHYEAHMNPAVIDASAKGQLDLIKEYRGLFNDIAEKAAAKFAP